MNSAVQLAVFNEKSLLCTMLRSLVPEVMSVTENIRGE